MPPKHEILFKRFKRNNKRRNLLTVAGRVSVIETAQTGDGRAGPSLSDSDRESDGTGTHNGPTSKNRLTVRVGKWTINRDNLLCRDIATILRDNAEKGETRAAPNNCSTSGQFHVAVHH